MWATSGDVIGVDRFGASAPGEVMMREYGFTVAKRNVQNK
jgi:transketolase